MDIKGHDLGLLSSLDVLLAEANVTRAAVRLGISQPALSAQLARLRDIFSDQLLIPASNGKGMVLTARAAAIKQPLRSALQALLNTVNAPEAFDPYAAVRTFTIATNDNAATMIGVRLIERVTSKHFSGLRVAFRSVETERLPSLLESGEIDLAWVSRNSVPKGFSSKAVMREEFRMAQRLNHSRGTGSLSLQEFIQLEHVVVSTSGNFNGFVDDYLLDHGYRRRVSVSVQYYSLVPFILEKTDLVCTLPARFLDKFPNMLEGFVLPFSIAPFSLFATWHPRFDKEPGLNWLLREIDNLQQDVT